MNNMNTKTRKRTRGSKMEIAARHARIKSYIYPNVPQPVAVPIIAEEEGVSRATARRDFKAVFEW